MWRRRKRKTRRKRKLKRKSKTTMNSFAISRFFFGDKNARDVFLSFLSVLMKDVSH